MSALPCPTFCAGRRGPFSPSPPCGGRRDAQALQDLAEQTPLCRLGTPEDVAQAMVFLASESASFITGQVLNLDGGFLL